jgi:hypothetical protein
MTTMRTKKVSTKPTATAEKKMGRTPVSEGALKRAALRLLAPGKLVSTEIDYIQRVLGASATQQAIDEKVVAVRKMPWASIAPSE